MAPTAVYQRIRAPSRHGEVFIDPPLRDAARLIALNRGRFAEDHHDFQGISGERLRFEARQGLIDLAKQHTTAYRDVTVPVADNPPLVVAGHQPQLFHAGVWFKNFVLAAIGERLNGWAINLLIDNDILRDPSIRVPAGAASEPQVGSVPFDVPADPIPYEERPILDASVFTSFDARTMQAVAPWFTSPLIGDLWPLASEAAKRSGNVGRSLAEARHRLEGRWGQQTWEVSLSAVCETAPFAWFTSHLLAQLPRFHETYNTSLHEYRRINHVRSRSHPVPDLARDQEWLEAPFWLWTADAPSRRRLFVRDCGHGLELTDRQDVKFRLPLREDGDAQAAVDRLLSLPRERIRLRPRALITTMYARVLLSDLFLHGIGGAKYDQLTDLIIQRFFGWEPPAFLTLSATMLLFEDRTPEMARQIRDTKHLLRDVRFHPERHVEPTLEIERLVAEKRRWIDLDLPRGQRLQRHQEIERLNRQLQAHVPETAEALSPPLTSLAAELRRQKLLASREFCFCLFPEALLRPLLLHASRRSD
jgi:hypothetical protein